jgi:hypothetical protein
MSNAALKIVDGPSGTDIRDAGTMTMTPGEWSQVEANPFQRDTAAHAKRATHLREPHPTHRKVNMAIVESGKRYKLDGHTRDFLWSAGELSAPPLLDVQAWFCPYAKLGVLYDTFDSRSALHTAADDMHGALSALGFVFESELLKTRHFVAAMRLAYELLYGKTIAAKTRPVDLLRYWRLELELLDRCNPGRRRFPTPITTAALIVFRRYGATAQSSHFWMAYSGNKGVKIGEEMDPVQALTERVAGATKNRQTTGYHNALKLISLCLSVFESFCAERTFSAGKNGGAKPLGNARLEDWLVKAKLAPRS